VIHWQRLIIGYAGINRLPKKHDSDWQALQKKQGRESCGPQTYPAECL